MDIITEECEEWKDIKGYEQMYLISNQGRVMSIARPRKNGKSNKYIQKTQMIKPRKSGRGYLCVDLKKDKIKKRYMIHNLVAKHFVANPYNKKIVNHIDGNKINNYYKNLEWVTHQENAQHAIDTNLKEVFDINKRSLEVLYINKSMSISEIAELFEISNNVIKEKMDEYNIKKINKNKYGIKKEDLKKMLEYGKTQKEIAEKYGCDQSLISKYKKRINERGHIYAK